jgi:hypothetical protein
MAKGFVSLEEGAELERLEKEHEAASQRGAVVLALKGMDSPEFAEVDAATGKLWTREIQGMTGKSWVA